MSQHWHQTIRVSDPEAMWVRVEPSTYESGGYVEIRDLAGGTQVHLTAQETALLIAALARSLSDRPDYTLSASEEAAVINAVAGTAIPEEV